MEPSASVSVPPVPDTPLSRSTKVQDWLEVQKLLVKLTVPPKLRSRVAPGVMAKVPPETLTPSKEVPRAVVTLSVSCHWRWEEAASARLLVKVWIAMPEPPGASIPWRVVEPPMLPLPARVAEDWTVSVELARLPAVPMASVPAATVVVPV